MDESEIVKLLADDWASGLRVTTVPQAIHRLGYADDIDARWRVANRNYDLWQSTLASPEKIRSTASAVGLENPKEVEALSQRWLDHVVTWGRASILLTESEKLVARHIWARRLEGQPLPLPKSIAALLEISTEEVYDGIQILSWLGYLTLQGNPPIYEYKLAADAHRFQEGLGFSFHTVTLDGQEKFGVP